MPVSFFFFFKQKTAYELRISDWSSDVCSSDLLRNSAKVTAHTAGDDGVSVTLADGATIAGDSLLACDGLWSVFRDDIVGGGKPRVSGHIAYRAVLPAAEVPEGQ